MRRSGHRGPVVAAVLTAAAVLAAACSGDDATPPSTTEAPASTDVASAPTADGRLTVGVLLPLTGAGSEIGTVMREAVELAVQEIEVAGGIRPDAADSRPIRLVVVDESALADGIPPSIEEIFDEPVDAIIGPASSLLTARLLPSTVRAGVITCSPTASALSLDDFPDDGPLFVRTIPSDELQARALARQLDGTGNEIVLAHVNDAYGRSFSDAVRAELSRAGAPVINVVEFDPLDSDYTDEATAIVGSEASTIAIIGDPEEGPRLVQAVSEVIDPATQTALLMNDAMRVPATSGVYRRLDPEVLAIMRGVSPVSGILDPTAAAQFPGDGQFFGVNAYDCMNLLALAASESGTITGAGMAAQIVPVSTGGTSCPDFGSCRAALAAGRNIDYDGPNGAIDIGRDGDPIVGLFDTYGFDPSSGLDVTFAQAPIVVATSG